MNGETRDSHRKGGSSVGLGKGMEFIHTFMTGLKSFSVQSRNPFLTQEG